MTFRSSRRPFVTAAIALAFGTALSGPSPADPVTHGQCVAGLAAVRGLSHAHH